MSDRLVGREADLAPAVPGSGEAQSLSGRIWMITFADLVTLMLAVFVTLFAMSGIRPERWQATVQSLSTTLLPAPAGDEPEAASRRSRPGEPPHVAADLGYLSAVLRESLESDPALAAIAITERAEGIVLALPAGILDRETAAVAGDAGPVLAAVAALLGSIGNQVAVQVPRARRSVAGTDPAADWRWALAGAAAVANGLRDAGYSRPIPVYAKSIGEVPAAAEIVVFAHGGIP
jgi:hypothetical protein